MTSLSKQYTTTESQQDLMLFDSWGAAYPLRAADLPLNFQLRDLKKMVEVSGLLERFDATNKYQGEVFHPNWLPNEENIETLNESNAKAALHDMQLRLRIWLETDSAEDRDYSENVRTFLLTASPNEVSQIWQQMQTEAEVIKELNAEQLNCPLLVEAADLKRQPPFELSTAVLRGLRTPTLQLNNYLLHARAEDLLLALSGPNNLFRPDDGEYGGSKQLYASWYEAPVLEAPGSATNEDLIVQCYKRAILWIAAKKNAIKAPELEAERIKILSCLYDYDLDQKLQEVGAIRRKHKTISFGDDPVETVRNSIYKYCIDAATSGLPSAERYQSEMLQQVAEIALPELPWYAWLICGASFDLERYSATIEVDAYFPQQLRSLEIPAELQGLIRNDGALPEKMGG